MNLINQDKLTQYISGKSVVFLDGFDMVGKTTLLDNLSDEYRTYSPDWHDNLDFMDYSEGVYIGFSIVDFISQVPNSNTVIIDRSALSSAAYQMIYSQRWMSSTQEVLESFKKLITSTNTGLLYLHPKDEVASGLLAEKSLRDFREDNYGFKTISAHLDNLERYSTYMSDFYRTYDLEYLEILSDPRDCSFEVI